MDDLTRRAERALLGSMIAAPWLMGWVRIRPEEFQDLWNADVLRGIRAAHAQLGRTRDTGEWRRVIVEAAPAVTHSDLDDLVASCPAPGHGISYASLVIGTWATRKVRDAADAIFVRARLLESDSQQVMRVAMAEGLEATVVARHMADVATTMQAHVSGLGRAPEPMDLIAGDASLQQAQREEAVLAGLLTQPPGRAHQILAIVQAGAFRDSHRRAMFRTISDMHATRMAIDPLTVDWELSARGLPLVRQHQEDRQSYATRLAQSAAGEQPAVQAARDLAAQHEQPPSSPSGRRSGRRATAKRTEQQAGRPQRSGLQVVRPPEADGPNHGPQQGR
ncbi:MAG TPA: DnaB-like helicase N-terminal domain-containing protein [Trebonia sp.]|nr:DnaB-like helicase N-terminal domain-containing protein [Trebonia sp.]